MNSTGSYSANLRAGVDRLVLICARHGLVSQTIGSLPPSEASRRDASSDDIFLDAAVAKPRVLKIMPQHAPEIDLGYTTSYPACMSTVHSMCELFQIP